MLLGIAPIDGGFFVDESERTKSKERGLLHVVRDDFLLRQFIISWMELKRGYW